LFPLSGLSGQNQTKPIFPAIVRQRLRPPSSLDGADDGADCERGGAEYDGGGLLGRGAGAVYEREEAGGGE
jgi:hypothetical protein